MNKLENQLFQGQEELGAGSVSYYKLLSKGVFLDSEEKERKEINFCWLGLRRSRIFWGQAYNPNEPEPKPQCSSKDAIIPNSGKAMLPGPCDQCEKSKWINKTRPCCDEVFSMVCWDLEQQRPFVFQVKGIAIKALRDLQKSTKTIGNIYRKNSLPAQHCCKVLMAVSTEKTAFGERFVPAFKIVSGFKENEADEMSMIAQGVHELFEPSEADSNNEQEPETKTPTPTWPGPDNEPPF